MKITIVQHEIEDAVRDFIRKQITIREGMEITMEFSATRGADGLTAAIDISPADKAPVQQVSVAQGSSDAEATVVARTRQPRQPRAVVVEEAPVSQDPVEEEAAPEASLSQEDQDEEPAAPARSIFAARKQEDDVEEVEGSQPLKKSIFSGLTRPVNEKDPEAA